MLSQRRTSGLVSRDVHGVAGLVPRVLGAVALSGEFGERVDGQEHAGLPLARNPTATVGDFPRPTGTLRGHIS